MSDEEIINTYKIAKEKYAKLGVDVEDALDKLIKLSLKSRELKRRIDEKIHVLFKDYKEKKQRFRTSSFERQRPYIPKEESYIFDDLTTPTLVT